MILLDKFCFGYKANSLLYHNLQLSLETGRIYGLLGKNGAGKSTLLKNLIGLLYPSSGTVSVNGFNPSGRQPSFLRTIYFIPEEVYVPALTINSYVKIFAPFYPAFDRTMLNTYLEKLDVQTDKKLNTLSFGQQKKFIIAFALACNTSVLIMDEPTNGLDIPSKKRFRKLISSSMRDDRIIFISTHQTRDLENLIDQVVIVDNGELVLNAPVEVINQKLSFKIVEENYNEQPVFYEEELLKGRAVIIENTDGIESQINLEQLFNAATENPVMVKAVFNK
jgi:ABC-2 type transport system ATP-binding protein